MDRSIAMLLIGLVFGGGAGFVTAAGYGVTLDGHDHGAHGAPASHAADHAHDTPVEIAPGPDAPRLAIALTPDPMSGWNLQMTPANFRFAPEHASGGHVAGEGHAHVHVNGTKVMRAYGTWVHLDALPAGEVTVGAALFANDHRPLVVDGTPVGDEVVVSVTPKDHAGH
ncbi:MAG: hypothetical protein EP318_14700 [Rhodobacteraceae bacterium]|nr:MAG: hypothetical protein EP318_14700 [Paracoccaceae bacterium]